MLTDEIARRSNMVDGLDLDTIPWKAPRHGMAVMKVGRTTGKTTGHLCPEEGILHITNSSGGATHHIVTNEWFILPGEIDNPGSQESDFSQSGDSGSVILAGYRTSVVGLMYASSRSTEQVMASLTFFMPAERVARAVNLLMAEEVIGMTTTVCQFELVHQPIIEEQAAAPKPNKGWLVNESVADMSKQITSNKAIPRDQQRIEEELKDEVFIEDGDIDWDMYPEFKHLI